MSKRKAPKIPRTKIEWGVDGDYEVNTEDIKVAIDALKYGRNMINLKYPDSIFRCSYYFGSYMESRGRYRGQLYAAFERYIEEYWAYCWSKCKEG